MNEKAFLQAIEEFQAANLTPATVGDDVCGIYKKVKPILSEILPFLKLIPIYGSAIFAAITALMAVLDNTCTPHPATSTAKP